MTLSVDVNMVMGIPSTRTQLSITIFLSIKSDYILSTDAKVLNTSDDIDSSPDRGGNYT